MSLALESIVKQLADSGIIAPGKLEQFIPPKAAPKDGEELIRELFKNQHLTKFQAQQVALGKTKALVLGNYVILDKIGAGGMGQVYKAQHRRMKRDVAIKMLPAAMLKDAAAAARFQREVEAAAKLSHPNIVAAHDADEANGVHFLVMEYVEGSDLSVLVKKQGSLQGSKALSYILQAARGLEFAHKKGVVHRDIKPANLLLDREGTVKVLDMGLARIDVKGDAATQAELTGSGAVMGTVDYMAPEQALSTKGVDGRADIYSLGCTLYYLLTGKAVYDGETLMAKLIGHRESPIPMLNHTLDGVPDEVQAIFAKMVAKSVEDRYQSMSEVIAALEKALVAQPEPTSLAAPAESTDVGLTKFFKELPSPTTKKGVSKGTKQVAAPAPASAKPVKANPKLFLYRSLAAGLLTLIGIPVVLYFALNGGAKKLPVNPKAPVTAAGPSSSAVPPAIYALEFDGADDYVDIPSLQPVKGESRTVECWISNCGQSPRHRVFDMAGDSGTMALEIVPHPAPSDQASWTVYGKPSTAPNTGFYSVVLPVPTALQHIAVTYDNQSLHPRLFVNGKPQDGPKKGFGFKLPASMGTSLGGKRGDDGKFYEFFNGRMHQLRVSRNIRYTSEFTPLDRFEKDDDTLALYRFDEGLGNRLKDSSGNKHHGQIVGAKWVNAEPLAPAGNYALQFDGDDRVTFDSSPEYSTDSLTVEAFVLAESISGETWVYSLGSNGGLGGIAPGGQWRFARVHDPSGWFQLLSPEPAQLRQRVHLAGVADKTEFRLYVDGQLSGRPMSTVGQKFRPPQGVAMIGYMFRGVIDELQVSKTARYDQNFTPDVRFKSDNNTLALYHFDEGTGTQLLDSSPNKHHGNIVNAKWVKVDTSPTLPVNPPASSPTNPTVQRSTFKADSASAALAYGSAVDPAARLAALKKMLAACDAHQLDPDPKIRADVQELKQKNLYVWGKGTKLKRIDPDITWEKATIEVPRTGGAHRVVFSPDGKLLVASAYDANQPAGGSRNNTVFSWSWPDGKMQRSLPGTYDATELAFSMDSSLLAGGGPTGEVTLWSVPENKEVKKFQRNQSIMGLGFLNGGQTIVAAAAGSGKATHGVQAWTIASGEAVQLSWGNGSAWSHAMAISPDGITVALSTFNAINLWDSSSGKQTELLPKVTGNSDIVSISFSRDGKLLASGAKNGKVRLWRLPGLKEQPILGGHASGYARVALSPNSQLLASAGDDKTLRIWDTATGFEIETFKTPARCFGIDFSADGQTVATCDEEPIIRLWDMSALYPKDQADANKFTNTLGMEFVRVPKGKSWLGGGGGKPGMQEVTIADDFFLGKYEVTQEEWLKVMGNNPSSFQRIGSGKDSVKNFTDAQLLQFPVDNVTWTECEQFLKQLNAQVTDSGWVYRLPNVAEWEYACRGGPLTDPAESAFDFYFARRSNEMLPDWGNAYVEWSNYLTRTTKVGSYPPNRLGLCDMHGNVWEHCDDHVTNDKGESLRPVKGGGWNSRKELCLASHQSLYPPTVRHQVSCFGLRVARVRVDDKAASFAPLFNGTDLTGWETSAFGRNAAKAKLPIVVSEDGRPAIKMEGAGDSYDTALTLAAVYENYHLRLAYKWTRSNNLHAKVRYHRLKENGSRWCECYLTTKDSDKPGWNGRLNCFGDRVVDKSELRAGKLHGLIPNQSSIPAKEDPQLAVGQWNTLELICFQGAILQVLNGKVFNVATGSRKKDGVAEARGQIDFVCSQGAIYFRDVELREINALPPEFLK